jgi:hypothetical protein
MKSLIYEVKADISIYPGCPTLFTLGTIYFEQWFVDASENDA